MIADCDIPGADPEAVIAQYEPLIQKIANRYIPVLEKHSAVDMDDLLQAGRIAVLRAQKRYDPSGDASFLTYIFKSVKWGIWRTLGINNAGVLPPIMRSLDEPIKEDSDSTISDFIPDPNIQPFDESIIDDETRLETIKQVRDAVSRLKSNTEREIIERVHLSGEAKESAADAMGIKINTFRNYERNARDHLRRDCRLSRFAHNEIPFFRVGVGRFNTTWTSAVEEAVIWREEHFPKPKEPPETESPWT